MNERYPVDLVISLQDFNASNWKDSIAQATREGYPAMWQALSSAAREAIDQGRIENGKVLWLLADACSMMLSLSSPKEGANKQVISSQADSLIKISRIWADFFPANTSNQPI